MMARDRHFGSSRRTTLRRRVGIAAAALVGSGAIAVGAVAATSGGGGVTAAKSAGYTHRYASEGTVLNSALSSWGTSRQYAYSQLAGLTQARQFSQAWHHGRLLAIQRGIVVLATHRFIILQSANGKLHLWLISRNTRFQNVSNTRAGTSALTASATATRQAMIAGNMIPATTLLAGSPTTAAALLTPTPVTQTVTVQVANTNLTVTVTVTRNTATVNQTATAPWNAMPAASPVTFTQNAWQATNALARGDLATIVGFRAHWTLHAQLVLFTPLSTQAVGGKTFTPAVNNRGTTVAPAASPTHW